MASVRMLRWIDRDAYRRLLGALGADDRRLRFGRAMDDLSLARHVEGVFRARIPALGAFEGERLVGVAELAPEAGGAETEIGLVVAADRRRAGIAGLLLEAAIDRASGVLVTLAFRAENLAMARLAAGAGFARRRVGAEILASRPAGHTGRPTAVAATTAPAVLDRAA